jgi:hypothetical protein
MTDFSKFVEAGMSLIYEVNSSGSKNSRWDWDPTIGWIDLGYTDEYTSSFVEAIKYQTRNKTNLAAYIRLANEELFFLPLSGHIYYSDAQWDLPGFFHPPGGWGHHLSQNKKIECSCGAVKYAELTRSPVTGHSPYCQITAMGV